MLRFGTGSTTRRRTASTGTVPLSDIICTHTRTDVDYRAEPRLHLAEVSLFLGTTPFR